MKWKSTSHEAEIPLIAPTYITITKHKPDEMVALYGHANPIVRLFEVANLHESNLLNALCVKADLYRTCNGVDLSHIWNVGRNQACGICGRPFNDIPPGQ